MPHQVPAVRVECSDDGLRTRPFVLISQRPTSRVSAHTGDVSRHARSWSSLRSMHAWWWAERVAEWLANRSMQTWSWWAERVAEWLASHSMHTWSWRGLLCRCCDDVILDDSRGQVRRKRLNRCVCQRPIGRHWHIGLSNYRCRRRLGLFRDENINNKRKYLEKQQTRKENDCIYIPFSFLRVFAP